MIVMFFQFTLPTNQAWVFHSFIHKKRLPIAGVLSKNPEVWLLDRSFRFYKLANTFSEYFRLVIMHFGLPQWQLLFTEYGPTPQARVINWDFFLRNFVIEDFLVQQFIRMYAPARLDMKCELPRQAISADESHCKKPNLDKIFKIVESKVAAKNNKNVPTKSCSNK